MLYSSSSSHFLLPASPNIPSLHSLSSPLFLLFNLLTCHFLYASSSSFSLTCSSLSSSSPPPILLYLSNPPPSILPFFISPSSHSSQPSSLSSHPSLASLTFLSEFSFPFLPSFNLISLFFHSFSLLSSFLLDYLSPFFFFSSLSSSPSSHSFLLPPPR